MLIFISYVKNGGNEYCHGHSTDAILLHTLHVSLQFTTFTELAPTGTARKRTRKDEYPGGDKFAKDMPPMRIICN
jgi:hypothetical protein